MKKNKERQKEISEEMKRLEQLRPQDKELAIGNLAHKNALENLENA